MDTVFELQEHLGCATTVRLPGDLRGKFADLDASQALRELLGDIVGGYGGGRRRARRRWSMVVDGRAGRYDAECCRSLFSDAFRFFEHQVEEHGLGGELSAVALFHVLREGPVTLWRDPLGRVTGVAMGLPLPF